MYIICFTVSANVDWKNIRMHGSDEGFEPKHEKTKKWLLSWCMTWDLNDLGFLQNFVSLEWRSGVLESLLTQRSRVRSRAGAPFDAPVLVAHSR